CPEGWAYTLGGQMRLRGMVHSPLPGCEASAPHYWRPKGTAPARFRCRKCSMREWLWRWPQNSPVGIIAVAYTDAFQLALIPLGLLAALPFALGAVGGLDGCVQKYLADMPPEADDLVAPLTPSGSFWTLQRTAGWWDLSVMLMLGGIPWNCYFQRVLS